MRVYAYVIVALGSAIGGALRYGVFVASARLLGTGWPYGTLTINVAGSLAIGAVVGYFAVRGLSASAWFLFLTTGVLGGFTTFSAFSLDVVVLYERGHTGLAALYVVSSVILSVVAAFLAMTLVRRLL